MPNEPQLTLKIQCHTMPGRTFREFRDVQVGIQRGRESVDNVAGDVPEPVFTATFRVARSAATGRPNFLGPYAQGTPNDRFVYLSWSGVVDGERRMFRRCKIRLGSLTWERVERAIAENTPLVVQMSMTGRDGGPGCTLERWHVS